MVEDRRKEHNKLVSALRELAPSIRPSPDRAWSREPALRIMDCVLSLSRQHHDALVNSTLDRFEWEHPDVCTITDLQDLMAQCRSPNAFFTQVLNCRAGRAAMLSAVVRWVAGVSGRGSYAEQVSNLQRWANKAQPYDHKKLLIRGFGLVGFQYLRMLFGANATRPDIHMRRFVATRIGRSLRDAEALQLLERAALEAGISLRDLDTTILERSVANSNSANSTDH